MKLLVSILLRMCAVTRWHGVLQFRITSPLLMVSWCTYGASHNILTLNMLHGIPLGSGVGHCNHPRMSLHVWKIIFRDIDRLIDLHLRSGPLSPVAPGLDLTGPLCPI